MDEKKIVALLNEDFSMTRENHNPEDYKTIQDFYQEYMQLEVDDLIESYKKNQGAS